MIFQRYLSMLYIRRPPSLFGEHCEILRWQTLRKTLKRWWGRLEKLRVATESGGDEIGGPGGPGDETGDKTAATAGDERDGGECKEGSVHLTLTLTTMFSRCQQTVQLPPVPKPTQLKQTTSPKTAKRNCFK